MSAEHQSIQSLVAETIRESGDLAQKELALLRTELSQNLRSLFMGLALIVVAAVFAIAALGLLMSALVAWLATVIGSAALAALIVGGAMVVIALAFGLYGRHVMSASTLTPQRTVRSIKRDAEVLSERAA